MVEFDKIKEEKNTSSIVINAELRKSVEPKINDWLHEHCRGIKYTLNDYLCIDTDETVFISDEDITALPEYIQFGKCRKFVFLNCCKLETLLGAPTECLEFSCNGCISLKSFEHCPEKCDYFFCAGCNIYDLTPLPRKLKELNIGFNAAENMEIIGCPDEIDTIDLQYAQFKTIHGLENCKAKAVLFNYNGIIELLSGLPSTIEELSITHCKNLTTITSQPLTLKKLYIYKSNKIAIPDGSVSKPIIETDIMDYDPAQYTLIKNFIDQGFLNIKKMNDF